MDLVVEHPDTFAHFEDISGDLGPNLGSKSHTIAKLYDNNATAWAAHDPLTVLAHHPPYHGVSGLFADATIESTHIHQANQLAAATQQAGIATHFLIQPGTHTWVFAAQAFAGALPWLGTQLDLEPPISRAV